VDSQLSGSLAIRAMRSVRSMAGLGSWAQFKSEEKEVKKEKAELKKKEKTEEIERKKSAKEKKAKEKTKKTIRMSGSSFDAGTIDTAYPASVPEEMSRKVDEATKTLGKKKQSILGLGLPSSMKFRTVRTSSNSSSIGNTQPPVTVKRSSLNLFSDRRPSSTISNSSSLRPTSTVSGISGKSSTSASSVKWDEEGLETVKEMRKKDREQKQQEKADGASLTLEYRRRDGDRKTSEGRKRPLVSDIFPETQQRIRASSPETSAPSERTISLRSAIINVEEATADGHGHELETPIKRSRPRPISEQLLGKPMRPAAVYDDVYGADYFNRLLWTVADSLFGQVPTLYWMLQLMIWHL
jgi:serine/arginine repetitive matrix protein 2